MGAINVKKVYCAIPSDIKEKISNRAGRSNGKLMNHFFKDYMDSGHLLHFPIINSFENDENLKEFHFYLPIDDFNQINRLASKNLRSIRAQVRHFTIFVYSKL
jgi:hypothetical protein